jgi:hypothetical protein
MACSSCNCDTCACTNPIQIPLGAQGDPGASIPGKDGEDGEDGDRGPEGPQGDPGQNTDMYDSGWKIINHHNGSFGVAPILGTLYSRAAPRPSIRVVNRTVFISGSLLIPLSLDGNGGTLLDNYGDSYTVGSLHKRVYEGINGGYVITGGASPTEFGSMVSKSRVIPYNLRPGKTHNLSSYTFITRALSPLASPGGSLNNSRSINLTAFLGIAGMTNDGKLVFQTHTDFDDSAAPSGPVNNSPLHSLISRVDKDSQVGTYDNTEALGGSHVWSTAYPEVGTVAAGTLAYPITFNGDLVSELGGFIVNLEGSYPVDESLTAQEIKDAFDSIP